MARLLVPLVVFVVAVNGGWLLPEEWPNATMAMRSLAWLAGALLLVKLLDRFLWQGILRSRLGHAPPRLLTDLFAATVFATTILIVAGREWHVPVAGLITTSGVLVAVLGFALRDMLASLFAGIGLNIEKPYAIGDWIETSPGTVGKVVEIGWLTTRLEMLDAVRVVVPNAHLATSVYRNFGRRGELFRTEVEVTLDQAVRADKIERILLSAVRAVDDLATRGRGADLKIGSFDSRGIVWRVRFWVDDYQKIQNTRYAVQRSILQHLHQAGIALPYDKLDLYHAAMPERSLDYAADRGRLLQRSELFRHLDTREVETLAAGAIERRLPKGQVVVHEGDRSRSLYVVLEGNLSTSVAEGDAQRTVNRLTPGQIFGEFSLLTGEPRSATVRCESDAILLEIGEETMRPVLQQDPEVATTLSRVLSQRQAIIHERPHQSTAAGRPTTHEDRLFSRISALFGLN
ncbi:MAG: mechanosensitive ion channel family protein [Geminicoccaceae bacterium]|nr:mechanosensitive ion channel family protein [Geminicoccaceae bacterium]